VYAATVSKDPISRITDKVPGEMAEWHNRPLGQIDGGWCRLGSNQCPSACEMEVNAADLRRKHFHALNGERLSCFDAYESSLHRT
jgi:hypothetical protein